MPLNFHLLRKRVRPNLLPDFVSAFRHRHQRGCVALVDALNGLRKQRFFLQVHWRRRSSEFFETLLVPSFIHCDSIDGRFSYLYGTKLPVPNTIVKYTRPLSCY